MGVVFSKITMPPSKELKGFDECENDVNHMENFVKQWPSPPLSKHQMKEYLLEE